MPRSTRDNASDSHWIAQRKYVWRPLKGAARTVHLQIGAPARTRREWACRLRVTGLPRDIDQRIHGIDSVQALELALRGAGKLLSETPEFRAGQIEQWKRPLKYDTELFLPLPMHSLQATLQTVQDYIERKGGRGGIAGEFRRSLLSVMREIQVELATLSAHRPIAPRRRAPAD